MDETELEQNANVLPEELMALGQALEAGDQIVDDGYQTSTPSIAEMDELESLAGVRPEVDQAYEAMIQRVASLVQECSDQTLNNRAAIRSAIEYTNGNISVGGETPEGADRLGQRSTATSNDIRSQQTKLKPSLQRVLADSRSGVTVSLGAMNTDLAGEVSTFITENFASWNGEEAINELADTAVIHGNGPVRLIRTHKPVRQMQEVEFPFGGEVPAGAISHSQDEFLGVGFAQIVQTKLEPTLKIEAIKPEDLIYDNVFANDRWRGRIIGSYRTAMRFELELEGCDMEGAQDLDRGSIDELSIDAARDTFVNGTVVGTNISDVGETGIDPSTDVFSVADVFVRAIGRDGYPSWIHFILAKRDGCTVAVLEEEVRFPLVWNPSAEVYAHRMQGIGLHEDLKQLQDIRSVILRNSLDNIYDVNDPTPMVPEGMLDPEEFQNRVYGRPVIKRGNGTIEWIEAPPNFDKTLVAYDKMGEQVTDRTGVAAASAALDGTTLTNATASAAQIMQMTALAKPELIANTLIQTGLKDLMAAVAWAVIDWIWGEEVYDTAEVNWTVGFGSGSRAGDMAALTQIYALQKDLVQSVGSVLGMKYVGPARLAHTVRQIIRATGITDPDAYVGEVDQTVIDEVANAPQPPSAEQQAAEAAKQAVIEQAQALERIEASKNEAKLKAQEIENQVKIAQTVADNNLQRELMRQKEEFEQRMALMKAENQERERQAELKSQVVLEQMKLLSQLAQVNARELAKLSPDAVASETLISAIAELGQRAASLVNDGEPITDASALVSKVPGQVRLEDVVGVVKKLVDGFQASQEETRRMATAPRVIDYDDEGRPIAARIDLPAAAPAIDPDNLDPNAPVGIAPPAEEPPAIEPVASALPSVELGQ